MKQLTIIRKISFFLFAIIAWGFFSCSDDDTQRDEPLGTNSLSVPVSLEMKSGTGASYDFTVYVFEKTTDNNGDYLLKDSLRLTGSSDQLIFKHEDLETKNYRFLFTATPGTPEIFVLQKDEQPLAFGTSWKDVIITRIAKSLSGDNYWTVLDLTGSAILASGSVKGILRRIVGQMVFDFFRTEGDITVPVDITSTDVTSVMDRVFKITIRYTGQVSQLTFDENNNLIPVTGKTINIQQEIIPVLEANTQKVAIPQEDKGLLEYESIKGAVRIKGEYLFPTDENMEVQLTFKYYDTLLLTDNVVYPDGYYPEKEISLQLKKNGTQLFKIIPDCYTVNKAGIHCNRIIDIPVNSGWDIDTEWNNGLERTE